MFNLSHGSIKAKEESAKAVRRSAAAKRQIASALNDLLRGDAEKQPPLPPKLISPSQTQSRKK
jgi:hypothetical protein